MPQLSTVPVVLPVVWNYKTEMVHVIGFEDSEGFLGATDTTGWFQ